jgi:nitrile hydratase
LPLPDEPMTASKEVGVDWLEPTGFGTPSDFTAFQILEDTPSVRGMINKVGYLLKVAE